MKNKNSNGIIIGILIGIIISLIMLIILYRTNIITISNNSNKKLSNDETVEQNSNDNDNNIDSNTSENKTDEISGDWKIYEIKFGDEIINPRNLFGSCISEYGSKLSINNDYTYSLSIGCNNYDTGTYTINNEEIVFTTSKGIVNNAFIITDDNNKKIKYKYTTEEYPENLYLLFTK